MPLAMQEIGKTAKLDKNYNCFSMVKTTNATFVRLFYSKQFMNIGCFLDMFR